MRCSLRGRLFVILAILAFAVAIRPFALGPVALPGLGLLVAGPLAIFISGYATNEARPRELLILSLGLTALCMELFGDMLNLPIPLFPQSLAGLFPDGWSQKAILRVTRASSPIAAVVVAVVTRPARGGPAIGVVDRREAADGRLRGNLSLGFGVALDAAEPRRSASSAASSAR